MATGLELVGALAAIGQLASQGIVLAQRLRRFKRAMKNVQEDVAILSDGLEIFSSNLCNFQRSVKRLVDLNCGVVDNQEKLVHLIRRCSETKMAEIRGILKRINVLKRDRKPSKFATFKAQIFWVIFDRPDVKELLMGINLINTHITAICSVATLEQLCMQIQELRAANKQIDEDLKLQIKVLRREVKLRVRQCEEAERDCEMLRNSITSGLSKEASAPDLIDKIADVVKILARDELNKTRQTRRMFSDRMSSQAFSTPSPPAAAFSPNTIVNNGREESSEHDGGEEVEEQHQTVEVIEESRDDVPHHTVHETAPEIPNNSSINQRGNIGSTDSFRPHRPRRSTSSAPSTQPNRSPPQEDPTSMTAEVSPNSSSRRRRTNSVMWVIHDNGEFVTEELRQPRSPPTTSDEVDENPND